MIDIVLLLKIRIGIDNIPGIKKKDRYIGSLSDTVSHNSK
jgi:hypothetical protein